jgi:hypothetical protein
MDPLPQPDQQELAMKLEITCEASSASFLLLARMLVGLPVGFVRPTRARRAASRRALPPYPLFLGAAQPVPLFPPPLARLQCAYLRQQSATVEARSSAAIVSFSHMEGPRFVVP